MSLRDAIENGPRATAAKATHIEARIKLADAKASSLQQSANNHARKAKGDGPMAKYHRGQAAVLANAADRRRAEANDLRVDLAKAKADEAARHAKHVTRTEASTAAEGLTPKTPGQGGPTRPDQVAKPVGQPSPAIQPKGRPMTTVSGEAVNIEQTRANLDQLKGQVTDLRGSFEGISGSLASGGLNQLAGSLASADDSLDSVLTQITAAEKHLSDQEAIAEAAQAAGEMHTDTAFYG